MTATFFVADLHLRHEKVAKLRGFKGGLYDEDGNLEHDMATFHHDFEVTESWRKVVRPQDRVFVLGDISGGSAGSEEYALNILSILPGEKHLISGNHDSASGIHRNGYKRLPRFLEVFESVRDFARIRVQRKDILLSHYPYAYEGDGKNREQKTRYEQFRLPFLGAPLIHGHTHSTVAETDEFQYCVSWDAHRGLVPLNKIEKHFFKEGSQ